MNDESKCTEIGCVTPAQVVQCAEGSKTYCWIAATMIAEDGSEVAYECCGGAGKKARFSLLRRGEAPRPVDVADVPSSLSWVQRVVRTVSDIHRRYPLRDVALYNGVTLLHFGLATPGLLVAYDRWPVVAWALAIVYLFVALGQMYVVMPLVVCTACVYTSMPGSRCVSGMNLVAARLGRRAPAEEFEARRTKGALSHNKLYMGSLIAPIPLLAIGLVFNFSALALVALLAVAALLAFRILVVFKRTACPHCAAKGRCPNAKAMGIA